MLDDLRRQREWVEQWRRAAVALEHVRADEFARLGGADALAASDTPDWERLLAAERHLQTLHCWSAALKRRPTPMQG